MVPCFARTAGDEGLHAGGRGPEPWAHGTREGMVQMEFACDGATGRGDRRGWRCGRLWELQARKEKRMLGNRSNGVDSQNRCGDVEDDKTNLKIKSEFAEDE